MTSLQMGLCIVKPELITYQYFLDRKVNCSSLSGFSLLTAGSYLINMYFVLAVTLPVYIEMAIH